ncbi:MAG TPA: 50S ribosomal protein L10 [Miltoncostaea sp.]|nr:50S ribosomal protein L10 [Miltoncostaea sp.]
MPGPPIAAAARQRQDGGDPLNRDEKAAAIAEIVDRLRDADTVFATDFRGLTVKELSELRDRLREADTEYTVVKNTLARRAANETGREALLPYLDGPTGLLWVKGDPAVAAKALDTFAQAHAGTMTVKGGLLDGADLPADAVARLAKLPSREQLLAQLAGGIAAPLTGLAGSLNALISGLARSLGAVQAQRASEGPAEAEAPAAAEPAAEAPAEAPDEAPAEAPSEAPSEASPEAPSEESPEASPEAS